MHIKKMFLVVAVSMLAQQTHAGVKEYFTNDYATAGLSVDGLAWDGFVVPWVDAQVDKVAPETGLIGSVNVQQVARALSRAAINAARAHVFGEDNAFDVFKHTLVGELGYTTTKEVLHQIGLDINLGAHKDNFDRFAAPYLKRVLAVALLDLWNKVPMPGAGN